MATTEFIAAIELSSSKISGIAGKKNSDGSIQVLAYAREDLSLIHILVFCGTMRIRHRYSWVIRVV